MKIETPTAALTGTEKQIAFAAKIRTSHLRMINEMLEELESNFTPDDAPESVTAVRTQIAKKAENWMANQSAGWWIQNQYELPTSDWAREAFQANGML